MDLGEWGTVYKCLWDVAAETMRSGPRVRPGIKMNTKGQPTYETVDIGCTRSSGPGGRRGTEHLVTKRSQRLVPTET